VVERAYLEPNGMISILRRDDEATDPAGHTDWFDAALRR
jgi:uncharacterized membrane protein YcaP (DUF421 family)